MTRLIVLAAGGTGGHVFPAQALAEVLQGAGDRLALVTDRRGNIYGGALGGLETFTVHAAGVSGRGLAGLPGAVMRLGAGYLQARRLLARLRPAAVVGFGGYSSIPGMLAATHLGVTTVIHEQNAVLGRANRFLAPRVDRIALSFATTRGIRRQDVARTVHTGNPVRPEIAALAGSPWPPAAGDAPLRLLVTGGSQGAAVLGRLVPEALRLLPAPLRGRLEVCQQVRPEQLDTVRAVYAETGVAAVLKPFFDDMPQRMRTAHLLICRAGASTIAELAVAGRPAILIPYPHAVDNHQAVNAALLCDAGGAWTLPEEGLTPRVLADRLAVLLAAPDRLEKAGRAAARLAIPDAGQRLAAALRKAMGDGR